MDRIHILAFAAFSLSVVGLGLVYRPRPLVQVVVNCGEYIGDCVQAVERAVRRLNSAKESENEIEITAAPPSHGREQDTNSSPKSLGQDQGQK